MKDAANFLQRYSKLFSAGAFATPTAKELAAQPESVREWRNNGDRVIAVARKLARESIRRDWTGNKFTLPVGATVITHMARQGDLVPDLDEFDYVFAYREDETLTRGLIAQQRRVVATRITAASEIIACWGRRGDRPQHYPRYDEATIEQIPLSIPQVLRRQMIREVARIGSWHDDFPFYCTTPDTEILTRDGWRLYDQIHVDDQVLTLNHETGVSEWQSLIRVNVFPAISHQMLRMEGNQHSSLTTLAHRWPVLSRSYGRSDGLPLRRRFETSSELGRLDLIPTAAPCADLPTEPKYTDAFVELVAWFWTEGYARPTGGGSIAQSIDANPANTMRIRAALTQVFGPARNLRRGPRNAPGWSESEGYGLVTFWLNRAAMATLTFVAPEKIVSTEFVLALTRAQLELFLQTSVDADGTRTAKGSPLIYQKSLERLEPIGLAVILTGRTPALYLNKNNNIWSLTLMERTTVNPIDAANVPGGKRAIVEVVDYYGVVWCPTTPNGTWLARRNGKVYFTGNSDGSWSAVSLRGFRRDDPTWGIKPSEMPRTWKADNPEALTYPCEWTVLADECPTMREVVESVSWWNGLERVRLLQMAGRGGKGGTLSRHTDITDREGGTRDGQIVRFHIPLVTHPDIKMHSWDLDGIHRATHLPPWSMWYLDARKPHAVTNPTGVDRVHLVVDVVADPDVRAHL
jgi:hypothetical protein